MNCDRGFLRSFGLRWLPVCLQGSEGSSPLGRIFALQTSHEGNWCQASIALRHGTCCRFIYGLRVSPRLFVSHSISITYRCGPCGVVGDAFASSKRSGKSTGFCWPPTPPLARQCVLAALHGDECMDKLKRRCGQSEGSSSLGASSRRTWVHRYGSSSSEA